MSEHLAAKDRDLARSLERLGPPPLWSREPGFPTLVSIILEQQVSLASARAVYAKLAAALEQFEPDSFLNLSDRQLKAFGFSRQKGLYCRELALAIRDGAIEISELDPLCDDEVRRVLMKVKGIGRWTADIYLLMALGRPDIWPRGDLALHKAIQHLKGLESPPSESEFEVLGGPWQPWRSVAARMLWNHYLNPE